MRGAELACEGEVQGKQTEPVRVGCEGNRLSV